MTMLLREMHLEKAKSPIVVTLSGMLMLVRELQLEKAQSPILVTLSGMLILVRESQHEKACSPIFVTLSGIMIFVRKLQKSKARFPIIFTPFLTEYTSSKFMGALSTLFQSLLYFTPNSSSTAFLRSSLVTSVLHTSFSFGFCKPNNRKEHMDKSFWALANRNIDRRVLASTSANKPCRAAKILLLLKSR